MKSEAIMLLALAGAFGASADRIAVQQNHWNALYRSGEEAVFRVSVSTDGGEPVRTGKAKWTLDNFGTTRVASGEIDLSKENPFKLAGKLDGEGFLRLTVSSGTNRVVWGVGYDVARIAQAKARPDDFDAYWNGEKARLAREVPLDAKCESATWLSTAKRDVFRISFATFGNRRVYGFMTVPKDRSKGPFRTRIRVCDAGPGAVGPWEGSDDEVTVTMNVHMFEPPRELDRQRQMIADLSAALAAKYGLKPGSYYALAGIGRSREDYFFHDSMLGIARAYDWIAAQDFTDADRFVYFGSSQGGGFGLATVYLNPRFSRVCFAVPAITGHYGHLSGRADGWPKLIANQPEGDRAAAETNAAYFDGVNFAAGIRVPVRFIVGFSDETCPPPCVYAAYNACPSADKAIVNCIGAGHCGFNAWLKANPDKPSWLDYNAWLGRSPSLGLDRGRPTVGVIRWDAWGGKDGLAGGEQTRVLEKTLEPEKYRFRLPWFAKVRADGTIALDGAAPGIMEREIDYAADAGIDYFVFLDYGRESFKSFALDRFLAAKNVSRMKFAVCFMLFPGFISDENWDRTVAKYVALMSDSRWLRVCGGRPLAFTFAVGDDTACHRLRFGQLRDAAKRAGINPYFAVFQPCPLSVWRKWDSYEKQGYEAVGSYAPMGRLADGRSDYLAFAREGEDCLQGEAVRRGKPCIPGFMTGWQKDPRKEYVPYWEKDQAYHRQDGFPALPTAAEIATELRRTLGFVKANPAVCPANTMTIYAWNEHDEGGWLCPTWTKDGRPDTTRLDAVRTVLRPSSEIRMPR